MNIRCSSDAAGSATSRVSVEAEPRRRLYGVAGAGAGSVVCGAPELLRGSAARLESLGRGRQLPVSRSGGAHVPASGRHPCHRPRAVQQGRGCPLHFRGGRRQLITSLRASRTVGPWCLQPDVQEPSYGSLFWTVCIETRHSITALARGPGRPLPLSRRRSHLSHAPTREPKMSAASCWCHAHASPN